MRRKLIIAISLVLALCAVTVVAQRVKKHGGLIDINTSGDVVITPASGRSVIVTGPMSTSGTLTQATGAFTGQISTTKDPASTTNTAGSLVVNPATSDSGDHFLTIAENGTSKFTVVKGGNTSIAGTLQTTGASTLTGGVTVGSGGAALLKVLTGTGAVDFTALAAGACENFTVTVTGAANGDSVALGIPAAAWATTEYATIEGFVSAADTVTVKRCNLTNATTALSNPASVTIRATVFQF